jgi:hypothetical protein
VALADGRKKPRRTDIRTFFPAAHEQNSQKYLSDASIFVIKRIISKADRKPAGKKLAAPSPRLRTRRMGGRRAD